MCLSLWHPEVRLLHSTAMQKRFELEGEGLFVLQSRWRCVCVCGTRQDGASSTCADYSLVQAFMEGR